uniref:CDKN1A interacting zinc finger protein 1 n=1 Tax=Caenorhabditis tropicalis TaxID=1561998 RepID=A0A1I7TPF8_9PELO
MQLLNGPQSPASNLPFGIQFPSGLGTFCVPQNLRLFPSLSSSAGAQQQNPFTHSVPQVLQAGLLPQIPQAPQETQAK